MKLKYHYLGDIEFTSPPPPKKNIQLQKFLIMHCKDEHKNVEKLSDWLDSFFLIVYTF